jgi:hypothetical protein
VRTLLEVLDAGSAAAAIGDVVCLAGKSSETVTRALAATLAASGMAYGICVSAASTGGAPCVAIQGHIPPAITGLPTAGNQLYARVNTTTARVETVATLGAADYPLGTVDAAGNLTLRPQFPLNAGGAAPTVFYQHVEANGGGAVTQRDLTNFTAGTGISVTATDVGGVTTVNVTNTAPAVADTDFNQTVDVNTVAQTQEPVLDVHGPGLAGSTVGSTTVVDYSLLNEKSGGSLAITGGTHNDNIALPTGAGGLPDVSWFRLTFTSAPGTTITGLVPQFNDQVIELYTTPVGVGQSFSLSLGDANSSAANRITIFGVNPPPITNLQYAQLKYFASPITRWVVIETQEFVPSPSGPAYGELVNSGSGGGIVINNSGLLHMNGFWTGGSGTHQNVTLNSANGTITVTNGGDYRLSASFVPLQSSGTGSLGVQFDINNGAHFINDVVAINIDTSGKQIIVIDDYATLAAGDVVQLDVVQNIAASITLNGIGSFLVQRVG